MADSEQDRAEFEESDRKEDLRPFLVGIAFGMALLGIIWVIFAVAGGGSDEPESTASGSTRNAPAEPTPTAEKIVVPNPLQRCTQALDLLRGPLERAEPAMSQWQVHIGAMNKLVVGEITLAQATAFWNQTRVGAHHKIEHFDEESARIERKGVDCPTPGMLGSQTSPVVRACSLQVAADAKVLEVANTAVTTWRQHVHDMDQLRLGKLSPDKATRMWLSMWQRGVHELEAYRIAERAAKDAPGCGGGAVAPAPSSPSETADPMESMN